MKQITFFELLEYDLHELRLSPRKTALPKTAISKEDFFHATEQLINGLNALHEKSIFHGDIKQENILISEDKKTTRFCDFDTARSFSLEKTIRATCYGTVGYSAPEHMKAPHSVHPEKTDIYALGVTLFTKCNNGHFPEWVNLIERSYKTSKPSEKTTYRKNALALQQDFLKIAESAKSTLHETMSYAMFVKQLASYMLHPDESMRPTAKELVSIIQQYKAKNPDEMQT